MHTTNTATTGPSTVRSSQLARRLVLAAVAGGLGVLALAPGGPGWVAWVALVPFFVALDGAKAGSTLAVAIVYALVLGVGALGPWLSHAAAPYFGIGRGAAAGWALGFLAAIFTLHGALLGVVLLGRPRRSGPWQVAWCAAAWTCWDAVRLAVWPRFPGGVLALSQYEAIPVLQIASVAGVAGVTFVLVVANAALGVLFTRDARLRVRLGTAAAGIVVAASTVVWGAVRASGGVTSPPGPRVVAVDVDARERAESTLERYLSASETAAAGRPALVVWPESALLTDVEHDRAAWGALTRFVAEHATPLLAGGPGAAPGAGRSVRHFNSAHFLEPGHGLRTYHKRGLVPFAERWPAVLGAPPPDVASLDPGSEATLFPLDGRRFGVLICFEITDASAARSLARGGAAFVVNLSNDAWFVEAPHLPWTALRAVEMGLPIVRAANAGVSALYDRFGRAVATSRGPGLLALDIPPGVPTIYARHGDLFLAACAALVLAGLLRARGEGPTGGGTPRRRHRSLRP